MVVYVNDVCIKLHILPMGGELVIGVANEALKFI